MFREKDLDVDGMMSYEEFIGHDTKMALAFKAIDKNGDGFLSKSEFRKICPNMTEEQVSISSITLLSRLFQKARPFYNWNLMAGVVKKWSSFLLLSLFTTVVEIFQVENAFTKFDHDKTGKINFKEFCSMLKKKKWTQNILIFKFFF